MPRERLDSPAPAALFDAMTEHASEPAARKTFHGPPASWPAISAACVEGGRKQAGLPPTPGSQAAGRSSFCPEASCGGFGLAIGPPKK